METRQSWRDRLAGRLITKSAAGGTLTLQQLVDYLNERSPSGNFWEQSTYYICLSKLSQGVARMPLRVMQRHPDGGVREASDHPLYRTLRYRPNRFTDASSFWAAVEVARAHDGNAYIWRRISGHRAELWLLPTDSVELWLDNAKILADQSYIWYRYNAPDGESYLLSHEEIAHLRWPTSVDGLTGIPVREALRSSIEGNIRAQQMLNRMYTSGMTGKAVVQYTGNLNDKNLESFLRNMQNYADGSVSAAQTFIPVPVGSTVTPLNVKLTDSQFLELKRYSSAEIAAAFGINPNQLNDYEKSSYASASAQQLDFYVNTMLYVTKHYEEVLGWLLLSEEDVAAGYYIDFDEREALKADAKTQIETLQAAVAGAIMKPNEARSNLELPAAEGGDQLYANGNLIPLILAGTQYLSQTESTAE